MTESKVSTTIVLNGGIVETWKINGFFYAKAIVNGVITFSDAVAKWHCEQFVFEVYCSCMQYFKLDILSFDDWSKTQ